MDPSLSGVGKGAKGVEIPASRLTKKDKVRKPRMLMSADSCSFLFAWTGEEAAPVERLSLLPGAEQ